MVVLEGKVALVTGSSRGIGRGCALEMARAGAHVTINYRSHPEDAEAVADQVRSDAADYITGAVLRVDGGYWLQLGG